MNTGVRARSACPIDRSLSVVGDRWTLAILRDAAYGARRFKDFHGRLGIAKNILSDRLRELVEEEIFEMVPASDGSRFREYLLTDKGRDLTIVLAALRQWGQQHLFEEGEEMSLAVDRTTGRPPARLEVASDDGRPLGPDDMTLTTTVHRSSGRAR